MPISTLVDFTKPLPGFDRLLKAARSVAILSRAWLRGRKPACLLSSVLLATSMVGCSAGRVHDSQRDASVTAGSANPGAFQPDSRPICQLPTVALDSPQRRNTLFVHPGLLLLNLDWDQSLALDAALLLKDEGWSRSVLEVRNRDSNLLYERMLSDPGTQFVGLHYSMGGNPELLRESFVATKKASIERGMQLRYSAILVDPFGISSLADLIDLNSPEVGHIFIFLSSENSFLRPGVLELSDLLLASKKLHIVYAEDLQKDWGHFGMLSEIRSYRNGESTEVPAVLEIFRSIMRISLGAETEDQQGRPVSTACLLQAPL